MVIPAAQQLLKLSTNDDSVKKLTYEIKQPPKLNNKTKTTQNGTKQNSQTTTNSNHETSHYKPSKIRTTNSKVHIGKWKTEETKTKNKS